jgi:hypothetical protein
MSDRYNQGWTLWFRPDRTWETNAITLWQTAYYSCPECFVDAEWRRHEDCHKEQWAREGTVLFILKYFWYSIRYGYQANPLEVEARSAEKEL